MKLNKYLAFLFPLLLLSCAKEVNYTDLHKELVTVGFMAGGVQSRTSINDDGISTSWEKGDEVALWAIASDGSVVINHETPFKLYFRDVPSKQAMFTHTITGGMNEDTYDYYATYPVPNAVNGTKATFTLPAIQDGLMSSGAAIMIATPKSGPQLGTVSTNANEIEDNHLSLTMNHATHGLRFYVPSNKWGFPEGEKVVRIVVTMPQNIAGDMTLDYTNPSAAASIANGVKTIDLNLAKPIGASASGAEIDAAYATIIPSADFAENDQMEVKVYSQTKVAVCNIPLKNPTTNQVHEAMAAGTITRVGLDCRKEGINDKYMLKFNWGGNNLGEDVNYIALCTADGTEVHRITDVASFEKTGVYEFDFSFVEDKTKYTSLAGQTITAKYDSEHAIVYQSFKMPPINNPGEYNVTLTVPYLYYEDFSQISNFTDGHDNIEAGGTASDTYNTAISLNSYGLTGWSGTRVGLQNGIIRACCRYESGLRSAAYYKGRIDTAPIGGLKSTASIRVFFDYGGGATDDNVPWMYFGHTTNAGNTNAGDKDTGTFIKVPGQAVKKVENVTINKFDIGRNASFDGGLVPYNGGVKLSNCTAATRLTWAVTSSREASWAGNGNYWLYIDNIKVQIVK